MMGNKKEQDTRNGMKQMSLVEHKPDHLDFP